MLMFLQVKCDRPTQVLILSRLNQHIMQVSNPLSQDTTIQVGYIKSMVQFDWLFQSIRKIHEAVANTLQIQSPPYLRQKPIQRNHSKRSYFVFRIKYSKPILKSNFGDIIQIKYLKNVASMLLCGRNCLVTQAIGYQQSDFILLS